MESSLSEWLEELARGLEGGWYKADEIICRNLRERAKKAREMEIELENLHRFGLARVLHLLHACVEANDGSNGDE